MGNELALLLIFGGIPAIIIFIVSRRHKERMEMIRKGLNLSLFTKPPNPKTGSLTLLLGLLAVALGFALMVSAIFIQDYFDRDMMTAAMIFLFGGGSLLLYWKLTAKDRERTHRIHEEHLARLHEEYRSPANKEVKAEGSVNVESGETQS